MESNKRRLVTVVIVFAVVAALVAVGVREYDRQTCFLTPKPPYSQGVDIGNVTSTARTFDKWVCRDGHWRPTFQPTHPWAI